MIEVSTSKLKSTLLRAVQNDYIKIFKDLTNMYDNIPKDTTGKLLLQDTIYVLQNNLDFTLMKAVANGYIDVVQDLIDMGACIDYILDEENNRTLLHEAIIYEVSLEMLKVVLKNNPDLNHQDSSGYTPLHEAVIKRRIDAVKALLDEGADLSIEDVLNRTPLKMSEYFGNRIEIVNLLKEKAKEVEQKSKEDTWASKISKPKKNLGPQKLTAKVLDPVVDLTQRIQDWAIEVSESRKDPGQQNQK